MIVRLQDYGNLFFECNFCKVQVDSKTHKTFGIKLPEGWKLREIQRPSHEGTNTKDGEHHYCPKCG